jgi:hypothetical protein
MKAVQLIGYGDAVENLEVLRKAELLLRWYVGCF